VTTHVTSTAVVQARNTAYRVHILRVCSDITQQVYNKTQQTHISQTYTNTVIQTFS